MSLKKYLPVCGTSALAIFTSMSAVAQEAPTSTDAETIDEVIVTGVRQSLRDAALMKQNATLITDNISTADIGQLPDVTIAEEINRLPGVNTSRDRGNASQAAVRGLGPRLVFGLVNGREVASSEPSQDLRWEIFPSEVLSAAQVYKSQDATLIPGGIAATIDIRTLSPLDIDGTKFSFRGGPTYNEGAEDLPHYDPLGYRGSVGFVTHINDDVAISIGASVQQEKNGFPDFRTFGWNSPATQPETATGDLDGDGVRDNTTWGLATEVKEVTQDRHAISGALGWRASDSLTIKVDALYSQYKIGEDQFQAWYGNNLLGNWENGNADMYNGTGSYASTGNSYEIVDGSVVAGSFRNDCAGCGWFNYESSINRYDEKHSLFMTGVNASWTAGEWEGSADLSFSDAERNNRWQAIYLSDQYFPNLDFDVRDGRTPSASTPGYNPADPAAQTAGGFRPNNTSGIWAIPGSGQSDGPENTEDSIKALAVDFSRNFEGGMLTKVQFGARASDREKTHERFRFALCAGSGSAQFNVPYNDGSQVCRTPQQTISLANAGLEAFTVPGFDAPQMVWGDFDRVRELVYPDVSVPAGSEQLLVHTKVESQSLDAYTKVSFSGHLGDKQLDTGLGVRVTRLETTSSGFRSTDNITYTPVSIGNTTTEVLPSLNMTLHLADDQRLRFGAGVALSRPPLDALVTGFTLNPTGIPPSGGGGNPLLEPYKANQLDLSYEWYFHDESMFAAALYFKDLKSIIGTGSELQTIDGVQYIITSEENGDGGTVKGVELTYQTRFHFLPGILKDFGVYANYAFVDSDIEEFSPANDPYSMVGLAKHTSQFDLFYNKGGVEVRGSWKHHSKFTLAPGWVATQLKELAEEDLLDASVAYSWADRYTIRLHGRNLTDERGLLRTDNLAQHIANDGGYQVYGRSYLLDFGMRF